MNFETWLSQFKKTHRMNISEDDPKAFTDSVMQRIHAEELDAAKGRGAQAWSWPVLTWPRFALAAACAAAVVGVFLFESTPPAVAPIALETQVRDDLDVLAELDSLDTVAELDLDLLTTEVDEMLLMVAAEQTAPEDTGWLQDMLELFEAAGGDNSDLYDVLPDDFILEEMELVDEAMVMGGIRG